MSLASDFLKMADVAFARPVCAALGPFVGWRVASTRAAGNSDQQIDMPRRVLVIRPGGIGDAVLFIPMLIELRRSWPKARLEVLAERRNASVLDGTGLVDDVLHYDRPRDLFRALRGRYDVVIDTEQYHALSALVAAVTRAPRRIGFRTNSRRHMFTNTVPYDQTIYEAWSFLALAKAATGRPCSWDPQQSFYPIPDAALAVADELLSPLARGPIVAIHPGASIPERRWPVERYAELARRLSEKGYPIVVLGGAADRDAANRIAAATAGSRVNLSGRTSLPVAAAVVSRVAVYVSADTGLLHLAYAVGTPTVHLFGPGVLSKWGPPGRHFRTLAAKVSCSPCTIYGYTPPCTQGMVCMLEISAEQVLAAVLGWLEGTPDAGASSRATTKGQESSL